MNIIVIGGGTVGTAICSHLIKEGHNVTVIDKSPDNLNEISNNHDATCILGNGADIEILREAGASNADLLLAITAMDEINMLCCYAAKKLGTKNTIARVRNPEYSEFMRLMKNDMNLSMTINPEQAAAEEISRILRFPSAAKMDTFCEGRVEMAEYTVPEGSPLCNLSLSSLPSKINVKVLVCGVCRDQNAYIPSGNFVIKAGDAICVTASSESLISFFKEIGAYRRPVKKILIFGGGRTTYYLMKIFNKNLLSGTTVIEKDISLCRELSEEFDISIINADGTKQDTLLEEGIEKADAFLALSDVDEENAIVSMYAKNVGVPRIVTMIRSLPYIDFFKDIGIDSIVSPKSETVDNIIKFVRGIAGARDSEIESLHTVMDEKLEALEFMIKEKIEGLTDIPLSEIKRIKNSLIACIMRDDKIIIPSGSDKIQVLDRVIIMTEGKTLNNIKDILDK